MTLSVNIIGAGNLGKSIGRLLVTKGLISPGAICNTSLNSTVSAIAFIGGGNVCASISELPPAQLTFITTPDDYIEASANLLSNNASILEGSLIVHCGGSLTSDVLLAMKQRGCYVASIHPMKSFANPSVSVETYAGTYCAMEGDEEALRIIGPLFDAIGSITYKVNKAKKGVYHAAGVFASNYLVTLAEQARICLMEAGVQDDLAMPLITQIMQGTVANLKHSLSPQQSLTGPLQRGDITTIKHHLQAFNDPDQKALYASLGKATLSLTCHTDNKKETIQNALDVAREE
ncbi:MAG: DUF2520 domain-containing protein [Tatlockia sp.]|jgi:predicted short-subunit dehydrogenase-like oxidoreductase (DUF2520 family)